MPTPTAATPASPPEPFDRPVRSADLYGRLTAHGHTGEVAFALTTAGHSGRQIGEAALTVVRNGSQDTIATSARHRGNLDNGDLGRFRLDDRGWSTLRLIVPADADGGIEADLTCSLLDAVELPPAPEPNEAAGQVRVLPLPRRGGRASWSGAVVVDGAEVAVDDAIGWWEEASGFHPPPVGIGAPALVEPQLLRLRVALLMRARTVHVVVEADEDGAHRYAAVTGPGGDWSLGPWGIAWRPGTRWPAAVHLHLVPPFGDEVDVSVDLTSGYAVAARALGSADPSWPAGRWHDEVAVGRSSWTVNTLDPADVHNLHRFTWETTTVGDLEAWALVETVAVGPHGPSGLAGFTEGYAG